MHVFDRWKEQVYFVARWDLFHIIDYDSTPEMMTSWVVVERLTSESVILERFRGQPYIGVVRILQFYQLSQSDQRRASEIQT